MPFYRSMIISLTIVALLHWSSVQASYNNVLDDDNDQALRTALHLIKTFLNTNDNSDQLLQLNQLREHLNRMCLQGHFGQAYARSCQAIAENLSQTAPAFVPAKHFDHDRQKRFFCNGFIGCKSVAGR